MTKEEGMEDIPISKLTIENSDVVFDFMKNEFAPDEPLFKTSQLMEGSGWFDRLAQKEIKKKFFDKALKSGDSFGAFDSAGNLIGLRLGYISDRQSLPWDPNPAWMLNLPRFMMSKKFRCCLHLFKFSKEINFKEAYAFDQCEGNNNKIYLGVAVGVAKQGRGKGLGGKLLKRSIDHAKDQGCSHMYIMATGKYSQKIMKNHGFYIINEKDYDSYKDEQGNVVIKDDVHTSAQVVALKIE